MIFWRSMVRDWENLIRSPDVQCVALVIFLLLGSAACCGTTSPTGRIPECPSPSWDMLAEYDMMLHEAPATTHYLGRVEIYCEGLEAMNE